MDLRSQKGFALTIMVALLPVLVAGLLVSALLLTFIQSEQRLQYACRSSGLQGQQNVAPLLKSLMALNPLAKTLKIKEILARAKLAQAVSSGIPPAIAAAEAHLLHVQQQRITLDTRQKQIIMQSNLLLSRAQIQGSTAVNQELRSLENFKMLFTANKRVSVQLAPTLAVRPDSSDIAPTYSPDDNFEEKQALVQSWQYRLSLNSKLRQFVTGNFSFAKSCAVTLTGKNTSWQTKIRKDRS